MGLFGSGEQPLFKTSYLGFWIKVYANRVEFKNNTGKRSIPLNQVASIQQSMLGVMSIKLETTGGKKYKIPCLRKQAAVDAIYSAMG